MRGLWLASALLLAGGVRSELVDRISVRVGTRMIAASEIDLRVRLTAFQNGEKADLTPARRKEAASQLIDQRLVEKEMDIGHYPRMNASERTELLAAFGTKVYGGNAAAMGIALAGYGLDPAEFEAELARQEDLLTFLGLRFRLGTDSKKADSELETWLTEQRKRTGVEYLEKELEP